MKLTITDRIIACIYGKIVYRRYSNEKLYMIIKRLGKLRKDHKMQLKTDYQKANRNISVIRVMCYKELKRRKAFIYSRTI